MTFALVSASSVLVVIVTLCWAKEFRLRRALQSLLARVFNQWSKNHETPSMLPPSVDPRGTVDPVDDRRMQ